LKGDAPAKINLGLAVGPRRPDGKHELVTVLQRLDLADRISVEPADALQVEGFAPDTLVAAALAALDAPHAWRATIDKRIPVAAGLGGGSSDAATALRLGNAQLARPFDDRRLHALAASLGADVPFFLCEGPQLGSGDGTTLEPVVLPQDYAVCLLLPRGAEKQSTGEVYEEFDRRGGAAGFGARAAALREALAGVRRASDLSSLPPNDLAASPYASALLERGAFRADVSGAGPAVYGLFADRDTAARAARALSASGDCLVANPAW
jgi:4-diphosphocytidyl-2-C-methyl-D-erythritol kinase